MNGIKVLSILFLLIAVTGLAACGGSGGAPVALPGQPAAEARATLDVYNLQLQATAEVEARQTAAVAQATAAHEEMLRATEGAATIAAATATVAAQTTADALMVRQTEIAVQMAIDSATADAWATSAWATPTAAAHQTADAQVAANVAMIQQDTATKFAQEQRREETRLRWQPILYGAGVLALGSIVLAGLCLVGFVLWRAIQLQRQPVIPLGNGAQMLRQPRGLLSPPELIMLSPPRRQLPRNHPVVEQKEASHATGDESVTLPRLKHGHVLVAGETGSGKTHAMQLLLASRRDWAVIDPHSAGGDWGGARVYGAGRNFDFIRDYMEEMDKMLRERYEARAMGRVDFEPLTVAVDEMPAIVDALGRDIAEIWRRWLREGRKVCLFLMLSTQSTRVKTLGIEGEKDLLENFACVLVLGDLARQEYGGLVNGMEWPAVLRMRGRARPVVIPHAPAAAPTLSPTSSFNLSDLSQRNGSGEGVIELPAPARAKPLFVAAVPDYGAEREPDPDNLTERDKQRIVTAYRRVRTLRAVQREIFPSYDSSGGRAFYAIKDTLVEAGLIYANQSGCTGSAGSTTGSALHVAHPSG